MPATNTSTTTKTFQRMNYQLIKFEYKHFNHSSAQVMHTPNWLEKLMGKKTNLVVYEGWVDYWVNSVTFDRAPYKVKCLLLTEWHNKDAAYFNDVVVPKMKEITQRFYESIKRAFGHDDNQ